MREERVSFSLLSPLNTLSLSPLRFSFPCKAPKRRSLLVQQTHSAGISSPAPYKLPPRSALSLCLCQLIYRRAQRIKKIKFSAASRINQARVNSRSFSKLGVWKLDLFRIKAAVRSASSFTALLFFCCLFK